MSCALQLRTATTQRWQLYRGPVCLRPSARGLDTLDFSFGNALWSPFLPAAYLYARYGKWRPDSNVISAFQYLWTSNPAGKNFSCSSWSWGRILRTSGAPQQSFRGGNFMLDAFTWQEFWFICALDYINCNLKYLLWDTNIGFTAWILLRSLGWHFNWGKAGNEMLPTAEMWRLI
jgi:hypothetical protein